MPGKNNAGVRMLTSVRAREIGDNTTPRRQTTSIAERRGSRARRGAAVCARSGEGPRRGELGAAARAKDDAGEPRCRSCRRRTDSWDRSREGMGIGRQIPLVPISTLLVDDPISTLKKANMIREDVKLLNCYHY
jgi:hypothetical protein